MDDRADEAISADAMRGRQGVSGGDDSMVTFVPFVKARSWRQSGGGDRIKPTGITTLLDLLVVGRVMFTGRRIRNSFRCGDIDGTAWIFVITNGGKSSTIPTKAVWSGIFPTPLTGSRWLPDISTATPN